MEIKIIHPKSKTEGNGPLKASDRSGPSLGKNNSERESVSKIMGELEDLIGLKTVKKLIHEIIAFTEIQKRRQQEKLVSEPMVLHMIFKGNPGTGKTTVARILARLFKEINVLTKGHLVEIERADLVGEYIGHTAQKTREQLKKSFGGILFIDEAYSLARGGEKDFGKEAIDAMVKSMEDNRDNLIVVLAGYKQEMDEFVKTNPGIRSRFPIHITFPDYTIRELLQIADLMLMKRQYILSGSARESLKRIIELKTGRGYEHSGNARLVRNIIEKAMRRQAARLFGKDDLTVEDLMLIIKEDIERVNEVSEWADEIKEGKLFTTTNS